MSEPKLLELESKLKGEVLYENDNNTTFGDVSLNGNPTEYDRLCIELKSTVLGDNDLRYTSVIIEKPEIGKIYQLTFVLGTQEGRLIRISVLGYSVIEDKLNLEYTNVVQIFDKTVQAQNQESKVYITKVVGYKK